MNNMNNYTAKHLLLMAYIPLLLYIFLSPTTQDSMVGSTVLIISGFCFGRAFAIWDKKDKPNE